MKSKFDVIYEQIMNQLNEASDIMPLYMNDGSNRRVCRENKFDTCYFHFYDEAGDERYILPIRSPISWIPNAIERLADDFKNQTTFDEMAAGKFKNMIRDSLYSFEDAKYNAPTREEVKRKNPFNVGKVVDRDFKFFIWELLKKSTGECMAWGTNKDTDSKNFHLSEHMPRNLFIDLISNDDENESSESSAEYKLYCYDDNNVNTYILPFDPTGEFSFSNPIWTTIAKRTAKKLKDRKTKEDQYIFKFLDKAINDTLEKLLEKSDALPKVEETKNYPITELDNNFYYKNWKLTKNGKDFCYGNPGTKYIKFGTMQIE